METKLEQIAVKARREQHRRFTSLAHHITRDRVRKNLLQIPKRSATGVDGQTVEAAKRSFEGWIEPMLQSIHRQGYRAPAIRRVYIPNGVASLFVYGKPERFIVRSCARKRISPAREFSNRLSGGILRASIQAEAAMVKPDIPTQERELAITRREVRNLQVLQMRPGQSAERLKLLSDLDS